MNLHGVDSMLWSACMYRVARVDALRPVCASLILTFATGLCVKPKFTIRSGGDPSRAASSGETLPSSTNTEAFIVIPSAARVARRKAPSAQLSHYTFRK